MATMKLDKQQEVENAVAGDSISSVGVPVNVKEYPASEVFVHEPPPAYKNPRATAVQIARIAAFTVISCSVILGLCIITASWIEATASCSQFIHAEALLHHQQQNEDVADRPSYQALVDPLQSDESSESKQESVAATAPSSLPPLPSHHKEPVSQSQSAPIQIKLPLQLDFDEIAGSLMEKNQRSRMNCVVEKKSAEEVTDHQPKTVRLPFGVNITTDPRYEHITGERMAIYCESGHDQRHLPTETMQHQPQHQPPPVVMPMPMNLPLMMAHPPYSHPHPHPHSHSHPHFMPHSQHNHMPSLSQLSQMPPVSMSAAGSMQMPMQMQMQMPMSMSMSQEDGPASSQKEDVGPITIVAREEHVIPIFQPVVPDVRPLSSNLIVEDGPSLGPSLGPRGGISEKIFYQMQPQSQPGVGSQARAMPESRMLHTFTIPENRQAPSPSSHNGAMPAIPSEIVRPPPPPAFHKIPIHVPTVLQQVENQQQTLNENILEDEAESDPRPHYVQPRSVRSVDSQMLPSTKRTRRYACTCTC